MKARFDDPPYVAYDRKFLEEVWKKEHGYDLDDLTVPLYINYTDGQQPYDAYIPKLHMSRRHLPIIFLPDSAVGYLLRELDVFWIWLRKANDNDVPVDDIIDELQGDSDRQSTVSYQIHKVLLYESRPFLKKFSNKEVRTWLSGGEIESPGQCPTFSDDLPQKLKAAEEALNAIRGKLNVRIWDTLGDTEIIQQQVYAYFDQFEKEYGRLSDVFGVF